MKNDKSPEHLFKEYPYSFTSGHGVFYQFEKKDGRVIYVNDKTKELVSMLLVKPKENEDEIKA